jgi:hypothetical protein
MCTEYNPNLGRSQRDLSDIGIKVQIAENLPHTRYQAMGLLLAFDTRFNGEIYPSQETLASLANCHKSTLNDSLDDLESIGLFSREKGHTGWCTKYKINWIIFTKKFRAFYLECKLAASKLLDATPTPVINIMVNINNKYRYIRKRVTSTCVEAFNFIFNKGEREDKWKMWDKIEQDRLKKRNLEKAWYHAREN